MNSKSMIYYRFGIATVLVVILFSVAKVVIDRAGQSKKDIPVLGNIDTFDFVTHANQKFSRADIENKITVVDFIFTRCHGPCPIMADFMGHLYRTYQNQQDIQFVSISVEPDHDTPDILAKYANDHKVTDDRWIFLNAEIDYVKQISENNFMLAADDLPGMHSTKFVLIDKQARIRGFYTGTEALSIESLKEDINQLLKEESS